MGNGTGLRIADNLSWLVVQEVFARLFGILLVVLLARSLPTAEYGSLTICLALMAMLVQLVRAGTGSRAIRLTAREAQNIAGLYWEVTGLRLVMVLMVSFLLVVFAKPLGVVLSVPPFLLMLSAAILLTPALTVAWAFRGLDNIRPEAVSIIGERALVLAGLLLLMLLQSVTAEAVIVLEAISGVAMAVFLRRRLTVLIGGRPPMRIHPGRWRAMLRESLPISLAAITASLYRYGDVLLLGLLAGSSAAALFIIPHKVVMTLLSPAALIGKASFPSAGRFIHTNLDEAIDVQARLFRLTMVLLLPACALAWFYAQELLGLLFGGDYSEGDTVLKLLLLSVPLFTYATYQENLLLAVPRPRAVMTGRMVASAAHVLISLVLIPGYGIVGAAVGCLAGQLFYVIAAAAVWRTRHGRLPLQYRCLAPVAASGLMFCFLALSASALPVWQSLLLSAVVYLALAVLLRGVSRQEIGQGLRYMLDKVSWLGSPS